MLDLILLYTASSYEDLPTTIPQRVMMKGKDIACFLRILCWNNQRAASF